MYIDTCTCNKTILIRFRRNQRNRLTTRGRNNIMSKTLAQLTDITKSYGELTILKGISFSIYDGDYVSIMGRSGCGKSTLLNIIGGMDIASSGSYIFDGTEISDMSNRQLSDFRNRKIGYVFQQFHLIKDLSVIENIAMPLGYRGVAKKVRINAAEYALEQVGLFEKRDFNPKQLSGGEQQRIAIARAIVGEPSLIIADEPTGNLDSETSKKIMALFDFLHKSGKTILLVTHDTAVANYSTKNYI